jgi:hypothetical protein
MVQAIPGATVVKMVVSRPCIAKKLQHTTGAQGGFATSYASNDGSYAASSASIR